MFNKIIRLINKAFKEEKKKIPNSSDRSLKPNTVRCSAPYVGF